jgi:dTDP-4-dehydrorhamnose 3,5-epimerase
MRAIETSLPGVLLLEPRVFSDNRGFFFESYNEREFCRLGITDRFVQDNHSLSIKGTLRGLHYQVKRPQTKICRASAGEVLDVVVDVRSGSPTFGRHLKTLLSAENRRMLYIPAGYAHGILVLSKVAEFLYKCSDFYDAADEQAIIWKDPDLAIDWPVTNPLISDKDLNAPLLSSLAANRLPPYQAGP